ncbi:hypothetical protein GLOTRDRAFT_51086 [Gloeophyllum trabeum ATCC 11539]|uniref:Uncharacterized protein n=1 Tax=Gloeophyllum trabeum (strain ATCC 11539 / FP-39264 / Madison 617) TaxID=670483 RepID=S7RCE9_GLOTA|nr:uncharacterized protein GLOTRDRAFT_51086 [Gloeophyllum trabeum ATCC 11539]EPQ50059.1 hypothetical protein GLOTRDRAFT_51086 [Gloeophyllum trabeum ATCC 11539]
MHLPALNIPDLLIPLWRGTLECPGEDKRTWEWAVLRGDVWINHGATVASCRPYLPTSFGRAPRNPAEKISSGYKAIKYMNYIYALGPGVFYDVLPLRFWQNFCKLVYGVRIICQRKITSKQVDDAHQALVHWEDEYERLYYCRKESRIPLVRPSAHTITHLPHQIIEYGPGVCSSQYCTENAIGFLGRQVRQPSNPFANLTQVTLRRVRLSALQAMVPGLVSNDAGLPHGAIDLGDNYTLMRAWDRYARHIKGSEARAIQLFLARYETRERQYIRVHRWSKVRLPNTQVARSAWKELERSNPNARVSRNVKVRALNVLYFMKLDESLDKCPICPPCAMVRRYSEPDDTLWRISHGTLLSCLPGGPDDVLVIDIKKILAVVDMVPHRPRIPGKVGTEDRFFVAEKPGLAIDVLSGHTAEDIDQ